VWEGGCTLPALTFDLSAHLGVHNPPSLRAALPFIIVFLLFFPRVSGLSPFMGDNDNETLANVTSTTWDFDDEAFDEISDDAKDFISNLLKKDMK
jgi:myosin-light-chain kinase